MQKTIEKVLVRYDVDKQAMWHTLHQSQDNAAFRLDSYACEWRDSMCDDGAARAWREAAPEAPPQHRYPGPFSLPAATD